jgi:DNA-binding transcriptional LysR family regulator
LREESAGTRVALLEGLEQIGLKVDDLKVAPIELGAAEGIIAAVEAGWGISWVSMVAAQRAFEMGKIRLVLLRDFILLRDFKVIHS